MIIQWFVVMEIIVNISWRAIQNKIIRIKSMSVCVERQIQEASEKSLKNREYFLCICDPMSEKKQALFTSCSIPLMVLYSKERSTIKLCYSISMQSEILHLQHVLYYCKNILSSRLSFYFREQHLKFKIWIAKCTVLKLTCNLTSGTILILLINKRLIARSFNPSLTRMHIHVKQDAGERWI